MTELVSACVVRRHLGDIPAVLLFHPGFSREPDLIQKQVLELRGFWDNVAFLGPEVDRGQGNLSRGPVARLVAALRTSGRKLHAIRRGLALALREPVASDIQGQVSVCFNHLHEYTLLVLGLLPGAKRVYYPHGLDQPRTHQLAEPLLRDRGRRGRMRLAALTSDYRATRKSLFVLALWLRLTGQARVPLPFGGVDSAFVFSNAPPAPPHDRIPQKTLESVLRELARTLDLERWLRPLASQLDLNRTCILLLPELDAQHRNQNYSAALRQLMAAIASVAPIQTFLVKPHPRGSYDEYLAWLGEFQKQENPGAVFPWPREGIGVLTELVCAVYPVRCVGSIGSCALPPWASFGVPHYVSRQAAAIFDAGWPDPAFLNRLYPSYTEGIKRLADEGTVTLLA